MEIEISKNNQNLNFTGYCGQFCKGQLKMLNLYKVMKKGQNDLKLGMVILFMKIMEVGKKDSQNYLLYNFPFLRGERYDKAFSKFQTSRSNLFKKMGILIIVFAFMNY